MKVYCKDKDNFFALNPSKIIGITSVGKIAGARHYMIKTKGGHTYTYNEEVIMEILKDAKPESDNSNNSVTIPSSMSAFKVPETTSFGVQIPGRTDPEAPGFVDSNHSNFEFGKPPPWGGASGSSEFAKPAPGAFH